MATSYLHIKTEIECEVYLFDELKGIATPSKWFNLEVRKGEQELLFVSTADNNLRCEMTKQIEEADADYRLLLNTEVFCVCPNSHVKEDLSGEELFKLGCCYYWGQGVRRNRQVSIKYWLDAYQKICCQEWIIEPFDRLLCAWNLGMCYRYGIGVEKSVHYETKWFRTAYEEEFNPELNYNKWGYEKQWEWDSIRTIYQGKNVGDICIKQLQGKLFFLSSLDEYRKSIIPPPYYLFFDTETTGLPDDDDEPASNTDNWPRLVQLAWILTDIEGNVLSSNSKIIKPQGFTIPSSATDVHGITTEKALRDGEPLQQVICSFLEDARVALYFVGHNISFDQNVVGAELNRLGIEDSVSSAPSICTMKETVDFCAINRYWDDEDIPELYGEVMDDEYEYPSLQDLYYKLFGENFEDAHDAMADVTATMKCFFELKRNGLIYDPITDNDD